MPHAPARLVPIKGPPVLRAGPPLAPGKAPPPSPVGPAVFGGPVGGSCAELAAAGGAAVGLPVSHGVRGAAAPGQGAYATPCRTTGPVSLPCERDASDSGGVASDPDDKDDIDDACFTLPVPNGSMDRDIAIIRHATDVLMMTTLSCEDMDMVRQCLHRLRHVDAVTNTTEPFSLTTCNGYVQVHFSELIDVVASNLLDAQGIDSQGSDEDDRQKTGHCWTAYDAFQLWTRCTTGQG